MDTVSSTTSRIQNAPLPVSWGVLVSLFRSLLPQAHFFRYSCPRCFEFLWSLLSDDSVAKPACDCMGTSADGQELALPGDSMDQPSVIFYDGIPSVYARPESIPDIHLDNIFSPASLFTLLGKKLAKNRASNPPRWIVLDPHERTKANKDTRAISQLLAPSLQIIDGREAVLLSAIDQDQETATWDKFRIQAAEAHLKMIVTAPGNRHAVSNVIGPVLLGYQPSEPAMAWVVDHLRYVLLALGLAPAEGRKLMLPREDERQRLTASGLTEFVLIDDQHRNGWGEVVKVALGVEVSLHDSAEFLLAQLERVPTTDGNFRLNVGTTNSSKVVLLLDLRLYDSVSIQAEAKFFARVLAIAEQVGECRGLPSPGFSELEIGQIKAWIEKALVGKADRSDRLYLEALTLLPRVLSLSDPSLPIVIFSSIGKEITERLRGYANIITDFEKPRLFGHQTHNLLTRTRESFWSAINKAVLFRRRSGVQSAVA